MNVGRVVARALGGNNSLDFGETKETFFFSRSREAVAFISCHYLCVTVGNMQSFCLLFEFMFTFPSL